MLQSAVPALPRLSRRLAGQVNPQDLTPKPLQAPYAALGVSRSPKYRCRITDEQLD